MNMIRASGLPSAKTVVLANCLSEQPSKASSAAFSSGSEAQALVISIARPMWSLSCACGLRTEVGVTLGLDCAFGRWKSTPLWAVRYSTEGLDVRVLAFG